MNLFFVSRVSALPVLDPKTEMVVGVLEKTAIVDAIAQNGYENYQIVFGLEVKVRS
jgi:hypothetical protein